MDIISSRKFLLKTPEISDTVLLQIYIISEHMKTTTKKSLFAVISAYAISALKDPQKRALIFSFGKKALTYFKKSSTKNAKK